MRDEFEKMKKSLFDAIDKKLEDVGKAFDERIMKMKESLKLLEKKVEGIKDKPKSKPGAVLLNEIARNPTPTVKGQNSAVDVSRPSYRNRNKSFQAQPESSCCDHLCRLDMVDDPTYGGCCLHRCRKPWL